MKEKVYIETSVISLTWNCKHLANATHRHRLESMIEDAGYACPIICTPEELMED
jgi:hypothetical protein